MANRGWLEEGELLEGAKKLKGIPGVIVQGRHDTCTPPIAAWKLKQAWPEVELNIIPDAGHLFSEPGNLDALVRATDRFAGL
jgi:proline iminopeptidase